MNRRFAVLGLSMLLVPAIFAGSAMAAASDFEVREYVLHGRTKVPYRLYVPDNYDPSREYPLIVYLHGMGEVGDNNTSQLGFTTELILAQARKPGYEAFIMAPQCNAHSTWNNIDAGPNTVGTLTMQAIDLLQQEFSLDSDRLYVTGVSMGAGGAWHFMDARRDTFAAAVTVCGGCYLAAAQTFVGKPIWAFHAADDPRLPVTDTSDLIAAIRELGGTPEYTEYATGGHGIAGRVYGNEPDLWPWLYSQVLPEPTSALALLAGGVALLRRRR